MNTARFELLGKILWLWSNSPLHRRWPVESAIHYIIPAIEHQQCALLKGADGMPRGYVSWAWLDLDAEKRYILNPNELQYTDWQSGDRLWFIDFISPFGFKDTIRLRRMMGDIHGEHYLARSIRLRHDGSARVVEHTGSKNDPGKIQELRHRLYEDIKNCLIND